jgi:hypothetical protein
MVNTGADGNPLSYIPTNPNGTAKAVAAAVPKTNPGQDASPQEIQEFFRKKNKKVATFIGYSDAEYEDRRKMLLQAYRVLKRLDPKTTVVNIGATPEGIGGVYFLAKRMGFETTGIVSEQAKNYGGLSPHVDHAFYVKDESWGGFVPGTEELSPTSRAMVENSDVIIGIGGGEVGRDEMIAAKKMGKRVIFYPADMNHRLAIEKAAKKGLPPPTDFRGAAHAGLSQPAIKVNGRALSSNPQMGTHEMENSHEETMAGRLLVNASRNTVNRIVISHVEVQRLHMTLKPKEQAFVKNAPLLGYLIKSDRFEDIPPEIRKHLDPSYSRAYLRENIGSVIALQMNGNKPDFYIIGKETFESQYGQLSTDNPLKLSDNYRRSLGQHVEKLLDSKNSEIITVMKTTPVEMIKMSDLGFPINAQVTITAPWGDQTKPAGVDSFLTWDAGKKGYYMVPAAADGNPLNYLPAKNIAGSLRRLPKGDCGADFAKLLNARVQ